MQIIEKNSFNVRSAFFKLSSNKSNILFLALPVVHIGSTDYYKKINSILNDADYIIYESVNSKKTNLLTMTYNIIKKIKRFKLIIQSEGIDYNKYKNKLIWNDIEKKEFDTSWNKLSIIFRLFLFIIIPIYTLIFLFLGTKNYIAKNIILEDLTSSKEIEYNSIDDNFNKMNKIIINKRDKIIIEKIENFYNKNKDKNIKVVLLYGAQHMIGIINFLFSINFRIIYSEWIKIFDL